MTDVKETDVKEDKPKLTICIMCKNEICALTVACFMNTCNSSNLEYFIKPHLAIGQSDLPKARSEQVTRWYDESKPGDIFMFIDSDQTFIQSDIETSIHFLKEADVVCGAYSRKNGTMTVVPKDIVQFYQDKKGELLYGPTGFMAFTYNIIKKIADASPEVIGYDAMSLKKICYPFFLERVIDDPEVGRYNCWISEDYSFCWLARQHGAKILGYISPTIGHIIPMERFVQIPSYKTWPDKSIVYFCAKTAEPWSGASIKKGIGGSELAVIKLSEEWAKRGYKVTVFCTCDDPGFHNGVEYVHENTFNVMDRFNILINWRSTSMLNFFDVHGRVSVLDLHDIVKPEDFTSNVLKNVNRVCFKSKHHASMANDKISDAITRIIPNGGYFKNEYKLEKDPNYIIYASSYDRGLPFILKWAWPVIKQACPNAYLKIFYGWNGFDAHQKMTDDVVKYKNIILDLMKQDGVSECGRIPQEQLLKEKAKANIHLYTGDFQEIDCISIRESACMGAIPIVSKGVKVFEEKAYCTLIDGNPRTKEMQEEAGRKVVEFLQNPDLAEKYRTEMMDKIPEETWSNIAERWITDVFGDNLTTQENNLSSEIELDEL